VVGSGLIGFLLLGRLLARDALTLSFGLGFSFGLGLASGFGFRHARPILKHDPEKWMPVFGQDHAQEKTSMIPKSGCRLLVKIMRKKSAINQLRRSAR
jgi:hypothetical protein